MGANASSANGHANGDACQDRSSSGPADYYELLGIDVQATAEEIRKAFRREALKWHPDKNAGSEEASRRFVQIQAAYDVLSDNQERAYYDAHRGDIDDNESELDANLAERARQASATKQSVRISAKQLTRFFDASIYQNDFSDASHGFYAIYRTLYDTINESERYATAPAGESALPPAVQYPSFGNALHEYDSPRSELKGFYTAYLAFASRRPFNEAEKYRLQDAPDRRVRRLMEKENKRLRDEARREYNEAVRSLTAFLKKRDPRFLNSASSDPVRLRQLEKKKLEASLRQAAIEAAKTRSEMAKAYVEQDWQKVRSSGQQPDEWDEGDESAEDSEAEPPHESEAVEPQDDIDARNEEALGAEFEESVGDWYCPACDKVFASQGAWDNHERSRKHNQNMKRLKKEMLQEENDLGTTQNQDDEPDPVSTPASEDGAQNDLQDLEREFKKLSKKERKRMQQTLNQLQADQETASVAADLNPGAGDSEANPRIKADERPGQPLDTVEGPATPLVEEEVASDAPSSGQTLSKRDKRRAREAAKKNSEPKEICRVCASTFDSRTKLFAHIETTGHASAIGSSQDDLETSGKTRKKGKRK